MTDTLKDEIDELDWQNMILFIMPDRAVLTLDDKGEPVSIMPLVLTLQ